MRPRLLLAAALGALAVACTSPRPDPPAPAATVDTRVKALADSYLDAFFERNPDQVTYYGVPGRRHNRLPDNSLKAFTEWEQKEDSWLVELNAIDRATIEAPPLRATYAILREAVEGAVGARVCRTELWNVSQMTGWQVSLGYLVTIQPVGTAEARRDALDCWRKFGDYLDTEIENLREGVRQGFTAPRSSVDIVIGQVDGLLAASEPPFLSPATRDSDTAFGADYRRVYTERIEPAIRRYRAYLADEYRAAARETIAVSANPRGAACYAAAIRTFSTLAIEPKAVHEIGEREIARIDAEMRQVSRSAFGGLAPTALLKRVRSDRRYLFTSRQALIDYSQAALSRARERVPAWFGVVPTADVRIEPYPAFRERNASNEYNPPAEDGSRPGLFYINAYQAESKSRAPAESTAFHETMPGHHLQISVALERPGMHPIGRYLLTSGFTEGWALYSERLADEMGLYSGPLDRLGMLSSQAFRAARLVVDTGLHSMDWTRQQAIDYMLTHTAEAPDDVAAEVDRYIVYPGQATAYMLGMLEVQAARTAAQETLGARFDIKTFHDRVLEDGAVPVSFLAAKIRAWAAGEAAR